MDRAAWARRPSGRTSRARRWGLFVVSLSLIVGTFGQMLMPSSTWWLSLVAGFVAGSGVGKKSDRLLWLLGGLGVAAGLGMAGRSLEGATLVPGVGRLQRLEVEVHRAAEGVWPSGSRWVRLSGEVRRGERAGLEAGAIVEVLFSRARSDWLPGDRFRLVARPYPPLGLCNAGKDDQQRYARRRGTVARLRIKDDRAVERLAASDSLRVRVRAAIAEAIDRGAPGEAGPILQALVLGERHALDAQRREYWAAAGVAHLLVVSGLHLAAVFWGAQRLFGFILHLVLPAAQASRARVLSRLLTLGVVLAYLAIVGFSVAVVRAALVAFLVQFQEFVSGVGRPIHFLLAAAAGFLLYDPEYARAAGFQLTFLATGALMLTGGGAATSLFSKLLRAGRFSLVAVGATAPILAYHFGEFSLAGIIINLIAGPILGPGVLALALPGAFIAPLDIGLASRFLQAAAVMIDAVEPLIVAVGETRLGVVQAASLVPLGSVGVVGVLVVWAFRGSGGKRWLALVGCICTVALACGALSGTRDRSSLRVRFLDVGQGDAILFAGPGEVVGTLVDLPGRLSPPGLATRVVAPVLRDEGLSGLGRIVFSHADWDHAGGIDELWSLYPQAEFVVSHRSGLPEAAGLRAQSGRARWQRLGTGDRFSAGRSRVDVLQPGELAFENRNDNSLVLALRFGATSVLLTGDIEARGESLLHASADLPGPTVLKVPHHGSRTSSRRALLTKLRPAAAVVQAARRNRFGFPHPEVVERYRSLGVAWLGTAEDGEIRMVSDGQVSRLQRCRR